MGLEKINEMRKYTQMSIDTLSEKSGVPKGTVSKITAGITKNPSIDAVKAIVHAMGFTLDDLDDFPQLSGKGRFSLDEIEHIKKYRALDEHGKDVVDMLLDKEYTRSIEAKENFAEILTSIPYAYDLAASAGMGEYAMDIAHFEAVGLSETPPKGTDFLVSVSGNSMEPKFSDGDKVYIRRQEFVNEGEIGLFFLDGNVYIKKQGFAELLSLNPDYAPLPIAEYSSFKCFGKVLGKCHCKIIDL